MNGLFKVFVPAGLFFVLGAMQGCQSPSNSSSGMPMPQIPGVPKSSIPSMPGGSTPSVPGGSSPSMPGGGSPSSAPGSSGPKGSSSPSSSPGGSASIPGGGAPSLPGLPGGKGSTPGKPGGDDGTGKGPGEDGSQTGGEGSQNGETAGVPGAPGGGSSGAPGGSPGNTSEQGDDWLGNDQAGPNGDDGWATSNTLPEGKGSGTTGQSDSASGQGEPTAGGELDKALDKALDDFDGGILEERKAIAKRNRSGNGSIPGGGSSGNASAPEGSGAGGDNSTAYIPAPRNAPKAPPPGSSGGRVPNDVPDAKDDDVLARQLREAAVSETDPELKEKLWEEYRRYKGSS